MRNLLLIAVDTLRPDHLGCYGYGRATSPNLDELAAESDLCTACWSASNFTAPAFTSLFTGLYPNHHGVFDFGAKVRRSPVREVLTAAGVRTAGIVTFRFFRRLLEDIWGEIEAVTDTRSRDYAKELPRAVTDAALEWLAGYGGQRPFALFLHYDGPHLPYRLPAEHAGRFGDPKPPTGERDLAALLCPQERDDLGPGGREIVGHMFAAIERIDRGRRRVTPAFQRWLVDRYDESIRYNDEEIGRLLAELRARGLLDQTVVAVISDHGEELLDHGHLSHGGIHLYESVIRTVALIRDPARPTPHRIGRPVSHVQLLPWLLRLAGAEPLPDAWRRLDLRSGAAGEPIYCIGEFKSAIRDGDLKYVRRRILPSHGWLKRQRLRAKLLLLREWRDELFDLAADPGERVDLIGRRPHGELARRLATHFATPAPDLGFSDRDDLSAAERARIEQELRDLGYL